MAPRDRGQSSFDRSYQRHNKDAGQRFRLLFLTSATHARRMEGAVQVASFGSVSMR